MNATELIIFIASFASLSNQYINYDIENPDLCSLVKKRKIKLGHQPDQSALRVGEKHLNNHALVWEKNSPCSYEVDTLQIFDGVLVVIQSLSFRKNVTTNECIDWVQFKNKNGARSVKFCGEITAKEAMDSKNLLEGANRAENNAWIGTNGGVETSIYVSKEPLQRNEHMDLSIVYTAYLEACHSRIDYKPCTISSSAYCIHKNFFGDKEINCPFPDCVDESEHDCSVLNIPGKHRESIGTKVLIGSISSLLVIFAVFILCIWVCKKHKVLCWRPPLRQHHIRVSNPNSTQMPSLEIRRHVEPTITASSVPDPSKDPPPSYDSLFPDAQPPAFSASSPRQQL